MNRMGKHWIGRTEAQRAGEDRRVMECPGKAEPLGSAEERAALEWKRNGSNV